MSCWCCSAASDKCDLEQPLLTELHAEWTSVDEQKLQKALCPGEEFFSDPTSTFSRVQAILDGFTLRIRLLSSMVFMALLGLALSAAVLAFAGQFLIPGILTVECAFGLFCNVAQTLLKLHEYPPMEEITSNHDEAFTRQWFYITVIAVGTFLVWLIVICIQELRTPRALDVLFPKSYMCMWVYSMEVLDWVVVIAAACYKGIHYENGLYWEDWVTVYICIWVQSIAECIFVGAVSNASFWMSAVPPTSSRIVRFKDKIQVALLIQETVLMQHEMGPTVILAVLAGWSLITTNGALIYMMKKARGSRMELAETLSAQFFVSYVQAETSHFESPSDMCWKDWVTWKIEPLTRNGPFLFAMMHDMQQAVITFSWLVITRRGGSFVNLSLTYSLTKPMLLWIARQWIFESQSRWTPLYQLRADRQQLFSQLIEWIGFKGTFFIALRLELDNRAARNLLKLGNHQAAENLLKKTQCVGQEVLGRTSARLLRTEHLLATSLSNQGDGRTAAKLLNEVLYQRRVVCGQLHKDTIHAKSNLATVLQKIGREQDALVLMTQVLREREHVFGSLHTKTLKSRSGLGEALFKRGQVRQALEVLEKALQDQRVVLGKKHPNTLFTQKNLANALCDLGKMQEAEDLLREVCEIQRVVLGPKHGNTLSSRISLAQLLSQRGGSHAKESLNLLRDVLKVQEEASFTSTKILATKHELAESLLKLGRVIEAVHIHREVLNEREKLQPDHLDTLRAKACWASSLGALGQQQELQLALAALHEVLEKQNLKLGEDNPDTLDTKSKLSVIFRKLGNEPRARQLVIEVLDVRKKVLGETHPKTLKAWSGLADHHRQLGGESLWEAEEMLRKVLETQTKQLGADHPNTLFTQNILATALFDLGKNQDAADMLQKALQLQKQVLGLRHANTLDTMHKLAKIHIVLGQQQEALRLKKVLAEAVQSFRNNGLMTQAAKLEQKVENTFEHVGDFSKQIWDFQRQLDKLKSEYQKKEAQCQKLQAELDKLKS